MNQANELLTSGQIVFSWVYYNIEPPQLNYKLLFLVCQASMNILQKVLAFEDINGDFIEVRKPSIMLQEEIKYRYNELLDLSQKDYIKELSFDDAYVENKTYRRAVNKVLELCSIDPKRIDYDTMVQLLFTHEGLDEDGEIALKIQGELIEFIFGPPANNPEASSIKKDDLNALQNLIGQIWAYTEDFQETIALMNTLDFEDLNAVLAARNEALTPPEEKQKKKQAESSKKLLENLKNKKVETEKTETRQLSDDEISKFFS